MHARKCGKRMISNVGLQSQEISLLVNVFKIVGKQLTKKLKCLNYKRVNCLKS